MFPPWSYINHDFSLVVPLLCIYSIGLSPTFLIHPPFRDIRSITVIVDTVVIALTVGGTDVITIVRVKAVPAVTTNVDVRIHLRLPCSRTTIVPLDPPHHVVVLFKATMMLSSVGTSKID